MFDSLPTSLYEIHLILDSKLIMCACFMHHVYKKIVKQLHFLFINFKQNLAVTFQDHIYIIFKLQLMMEN